MNSEDEKPRLVYKSVNDLQVAYIRFLGQYSQIPEYFEKLQRAAGNYINGNLICLYDRTADDVPEAHYIEVCAPVTQAVEDGDVHTKILRACKVMSATHPIPRNTAWGSAKWWGELGSYVRANYMTVDEDPLREMRYLQDGIEVSEVQLVMQFPRWIAGLSQGLQEYGGDELRQQVMAGAAGLEANTPIETRLDWVAQAMTMLDEAIPDTDSRGRIIHGCAHHFPQVRIEKMRALYQELGSIDALIEWIHQDKVANGGTSWYGNPEREGDIIFDIKDPASPEEYKQAQSSLDKRIARCFCPIVRAAIKTDRKLSTTFCNCSAGYTAQFWQSVLQVPLHIEVVENVLQGDEVCKFAIHLPEGMLAAKQS